MYHWVIDKYLFRGLSPCVEIIIACRCWKFNTTIWSLAMIIRFTRPRVVWIEFCKKYAHHRLHLIKNNVIPNHHSQSSFSNPHWFLNFFGMYFLRWISDDDSYSQFKRVNLLKVSRTDKVICEDLKTQTLTQLQRI